MMHVGTPWNRPHMTLLEAVTIAGDRYSFHQWMNPFTTFRIDDRGNHGPIGSPIAFRTRGRSKPRKKSNSVEVQIIRPTIGRAGW